MGNVDGIPRTIPGNSKRQVRAPKVPKLFFFRTTFGTLGALTFPFRAPLDGSRNTTLRTTSIKIIKFV